LCCKPIGFNNFEQKKERIHMKKIIALLLSGMMTLSMTACGSKPAEFQSAPTKSETPEASSEAAPADKEITVAGVVFQEDQFMKLMQMGYEEAAKNLGVKCLVSNTNNEQAK